MVGDGALVARLARDGWSVPAALDVFDHAAVEVASDAVVDQWLATAMGPRSVLEVGRGRGVGEGGAVHVAASALDRPSLLCGQSGSGRSHALGVLLEQVLLQTELRVVVLDPNSEYVQLAQLQPPGVGGSARLAELSSRTHVFRAHDGPYRLGVRFGHLPFAMQAALLALDPVLNPQQYGLLRRTAESMQAPDYSLADLRRRLDVRGDRARRRLALRIDNLGLQSWGIWAEDGEAPLLDRMPGDWRAAVLDLGGLASAEERSAVAAAVLAELAQVRHEGDPVLIVIDEAQALCPAFARDRGQAAVLHQAVSIATEGRRFGLSLLVATDRPQELAVDVLSSCENLLLMKLDSAADIAYLEAAFSQVPGALIEQASGFVLGEGLIAGRVTPRPRLFRAGMRRSPEGAPDLPAAGAHRDPSPVPALA